MFVVMFGDFFWVNDFIEIVLGLEDLYFIDCALWVFFQVGVFIFMGWLVIFFDYFEYGVWVIVYQGAMMFVYLFLV